MRSLLEYNARAALCRQFARLEPDSKNVWLAEADRWSRLTQKSDAAAGRGAPVKAWCWEVMPKCKHRAAKTAEAQFELRNLAKPAGKDTFEERLRGMSV
jgi:hypothetical protein